eukprot:scaffold93394_cov60-Phaeocystis_antarctica.AAC.1
MAQASANRLSGGLSQRQSMPQDGPSFGQPRPISRLGGAGRPQRAACGRRVGVAFTECVASRSR